MENKIVYLISGGIAAGKSTLTYNIVKKFHLETLPLVCTDIFYKAFFFDDTSFNFDAGYSKARRYTDRILENYLQTGRSFVWETVVSKEKKLHFIRRLKESGYKIIYFFVGTDNASVTTERSNRRAEEGNHFVSEDFITDRYKKSLNTFHLAKSYADTISVFDNTQQMTLIYYKGETTFEASKPPKWFVDYFDAEN